MNNRARLTLSSAVLLVGAVTSACGGGGSGAPTDASEDSFCEAVNSLTADLVPEDMSNPEMPSDEDMAQSVKDWAAEMEEVGTPEGISDDARAGFETVVEQSKDIDASDFSMENLEQLGEGGADASEEEKKEAEAFGTYLTETCGDPTADLEMPDLEMPETTE